MPNTYFSHLLLPTRRQARGWRVNECCDPFAARSKPNLTLTSQADVDMRAETEQRTKRSQNIRFVQQVCNNITAYSIRVHYCMHILSIHEKSHTLSALLVISLFAWAMDVLGSAAK
ncbi:hypothetical protein QR685DRAFT_523458 [Neurospora intermedia]|uniref:Uncharacterized protein n=1 Tax=Neurospora intermedia TaxID=5142 RepID=A0ABR3DDB3_NEUIN